MIKKAVVFIFVDFKNDTVLIENRLPNQYLNEHRLFPGGKVEPNEYDNLTLTLKREIKEELGIIDFKYIELKNKVKGLNGFWLFPFIIFDWSGNIPNKSLDKGNVLEWVHIDLFIPTLKPVNKLKELAKKHIVSHNLIDTLPNLRL